jgi:hypothetical protein
VAGARRELDAEEWAILTVLSQGGGGPRQKTAPEIAAIIQCDPAAVNLSLIKLEREGLALSISGPDGDALWMSTTAT